MIHFRLDENFVAFQDWQLRNCSGFGKGGYTASLNTSSLYKMAFIHGNEFLVGSTLLVQNLPTGLSTDHLTQIFKFGSPPVRLKVFLYELIFPFPSNILLIFFQFSDVCSLARNLSFFFLEIFCHLFSPLKYF